MKKMYDNKTRVAAISGGTGYIGAETAKRLAKDGMRIALLHRRAEPEAPATLIGSLMGSGHHAYHCNIEREGEVLRTLARIEQDMGTPFACIHAAGTLPKPVPLHRSSVESIRAEFETNVFGTFAFLSACGARLKEKGNGVLIGITTAAVLSSTNTHTRGVYNPAKCAVQGMLAAFKEELAPHGVRVYSVAPGVMAGGLNRATPRAFLDMAKALSPSKRLAESSDVAGVISFLCSEDARSLTNLTLLVAPESTAP